MQDVYVFISARKKKIFIANHKLLYIKLTISVSPLIRKSDALKMPKLHHLVIMYVPVSKVGF